MESVVIVSGARTPFASLSGELANLSAPELGAIAVREAVARANLAPEDIQEVIMGNVLSAGLGQAPARRASRGAGIPDAVGATTINKMCGSGMKAVMMAHDSLMAGMNDVMVAVFPSLLFALPSVVVGGGTLTR